MEEGIATGSTIEDQIFAKHLDDSIRALGVQVLRSLVASPRADTNLRAPDWSVRNRWRGAREVADAPPYTKVLSDYPARQSPNATAQ